MVRHLLARVLGSQPGSSPRFHFLGKLSHRFLRNDASLTARQRGFSVVESRQELGALPLTLLPQPQGLLHRILRTVQASGLDGLPDKRFLIWGQTDFHGSSV